MAALKPKEMLKITVLGTTVVVLTPIVGGFLGGIDLLSTSIFGLVEVGTAIAAGISAWIADFAITKWWK